MPAVRKPASTETAVQCVSVEGWTQSFARTRGRSRRSRQCCPPLLESQETAASRAAPTPRNLLRLWPGVRSPAIEGKKWNHPVLVGPSTDPTSTSFGRITGGTVNTPRYVQFQLRLTF